MDPVRTIKYAVQGAYASLNPSYRSGDEFGRCSVCGNYSRFRRGLVLRPGSDAAAASGWDGRFIDEINITNSLACSYCLAKFRVRCAAESMLKRVEEGRIGSVACLAEKLRDGTIGPDWQALETTAHEGIFSGFGEIANVVKSEYFDDLGRGRSRDGVRSEDLQALTFADRSFDLVIALDVFEHIADPYRAFEQVRRVLKPSGIALVTVPVDPRVRGTKAIAKMESGKIIYLGKRARHSDPLRQEGCPVFTEFGTDLADRLNGSGYDASWDIYRTKRTRVEQRVLVLKNR